MVRFFDRVLEAVAHMEVKSNGIKKKGDDLQEAEGIIKKQNVTMAMQVKSNVINKTGNDLKKGEGIVKKKNVTMSREGIVQKQNVTMAMEVKSKGISKKADDWKEGEGIVQKQNVNMAMKVKSNGISKAADDLKEGEDIVKKQNVTMAMEVFDCPVCSTPLRPPIFQCSKGIFMCSPCHDKLPESERSASQRCYGMERVVNNIFIPCKHGCTTKITYYQKDCHERSCRKGPFICPASGCGFSAPTAVLLDHLTTLHELPSKSIEYFVPFEHQVQPGSLVLCGKYGRLFLLHVASPESLGHAVSLVCVQPETLGVTIGCSVCFSCFKGHYQVSSLNIDSLSMPTQRFCIVPKVPGGDTDVLLKITIDLVYDEDYELEEEDDDDDDYKEDDDYDSDEEEDDDGSDEERMTELDDHKW